LTNRLGVPLTEHRIFEIFAEVKGPGVKANDLELNEEEFARALSYLKERQILKSIEILKISPTTLYSSLAVLMMILVVLFVFIFLGIDAFTIGGTFSALVNSVLPALGALTLAGKKQKNELNQSAVEQACKSSMAIYHAQDK